MRPVSPVLIGYENNTLEKQVAENQAQYQTIPALPMNSDLPGTILTRWELSDEELEILKETRSIYLYVATFHQPLQPVFLKVEPPVPEEIDEKYAEIVRHMIPDEQGPAQGIVQLSYEKSN